MAKTISIDEIAPDFTLKDFNGEAVSLSSFRGDKIVLLVFNRGFM
jgi:peroxiredoxin